MLAELDRQAAALMAMECVAIGAVEIGYAADVCYVGQSHFLEVPLNPLEPNATDRLYRDFVALHERVYGHGTQGPATIVSLRSTHRAAGSDFENMKPSFSGTATDASPIVKGRRPVLFRGTAAPLACDILDRAALLPGMTVPGPAIIEQPDTTTVIEPGWLARVLPSSCLVLTRKQH